MTIFLSLGRTGAGMTGRSFALLGKTITQEVIDVISLVVYCPEHADD
jgi:hypothetical protein